MKDYIFERKRKFLGAEGALFRFGVKSRKSGRRRRLVFHSEEARGAAGALRHRGLFLKLLRAKALFPKLFRGPPTPGEGCLSALPKCDHKRTNQRGAAYSSDLSSMTLYRTAAMGANASTEAILEIMRRVETRFEQKFTSRWG